MLAALLFVTALALLLSTAGVTLAKYISSRQNTGAAVAKPFYFSSDKLAEDLPHYRIDPPGSGTTVTLTFTLSNYVDDLRRTEETIAYTYKAVSGTDVSAAAIQDASGNTAQGQGELKASDVSPKTITLEVPLSAFNGDGVVTVAATATSPYEKTIGAQFGFTALENVVQYTAQTTGNAVVLELSGGSGENVSVTWPQGLVPDTTNPIFLGYSGHTVTFVPESGKRYALTFLKENPGTDFQKEDFSVVQS